MFTWRVLLDMGIRQRSYWLRQAEALRRKRIAEIVHGVGIVLAEKSDHERAIDDLELGKTAEESRDQRSEAAWDLAMVFGGGKGV